MEIPLFVKCPNDECSRSTNWVCSDCYADCLLTECGYVKCSDGCFNTFIQFIRFLCGSKMHSNEENYYTEASDFLLALNTAIRAGQISKSNDQKALNKFIANITTSICSQWR